MNAFQISYKCDAILSFVDAMNKNLILTQKFNFFIFHLKIIIVGISYSTKGQGQKSRSKLGQTMKMTETLFLEYFLVNHFETS
jgi:hypothetical protein